MSLALGTRVTLRIPWDMPQPFKALVPQEHPLSLPLPQLSGLSAAWPAFAPGGHSWDISKCFQQTLSRKPIQLNKGYTLYWSLRESVQVNHMTTVF